MNKQQIDILCYQVGVFLLAHDYKPNRLLLAWFKLLRTADDSRWVVARALALQRELDHEKRKRKLDRSGSTSQGRRAMEGFSLEAGAV